ncbi:hypothetical protein DKG79_24080 (plasmid) [Escherichia fergusonii]|nr:hypothetical protein DKG79_24080 [Escherichia fergusonii]
MASKKFYSDDDIQLAKAALSELPDLTAQRKTLRDFLDAIRDDIIVLVRTAYFHERRSLNNFHRDRVITFEQIAE